MTSDSAAVPPVAVLVPHGPDVPSEFALSLRGLDVPAGSVFIGSSVRPIDAARNHLARLALESGARWFLWLDSDTVFPADLLRRLLALKVPFASGHYIVETVDRSPKVSAYVKRDEGGYSALTPPYASAPVVEVDGIGFGCTLTSAELFRQSPDPWFAWTYGKSEGGVGEDFYFCEHVAKATGVRPVVDLRLRVGHVKTRTYWPEEWSAEEAPSAAAASAAAASADEA